MKWIFLLLVLCAGCATSQTQTQIQVQYSNPDVPGLTVNLATVSFSSQEK